MGGRGRSIYSELVPYECIFFRGGARRKWRPRRLKKAYRTVPERVRRRGQGVYSRPMDTVSDPQHCVSRSSRLTWRSSRSEIRGPLPVL